MTSNEVTHIIVIVRSSRHSKPSQKKKNKKRNEDLGKKGKKNIH